jgi:hypothetical protein
VHVQIIDFHLKGITETEYAALCENLAPAFGALSGLVGKVWLTDRGTGTFGGVYLWENRQAMERFTQTDLFKAVATHPNLTDITSRDFAVLDAPTRVTRGSIEVSA